MKIEKKTNVLEAADFLFDPNLSSAARYSPTYTADSCPNIILVPNVGDIVNDSTLLRLEDTHQTFILSSTNDPGLFVRTVHEIEAHTLPAYGDQQIIAADYNQSRQINSFAPSNQQDGVEESQTTQIIFQKMDEDGTILQQYPNILIDNESNVREEQLASVHNIHTHANYQQEEYNANNNYGDETSGPNDCILGETNGIGLLVNAFDDRHNNLLIDHANQQHFEEKTLLNTNELDLSTEIDVNTEYISVNQKNHERMLLEDSMFPLLTAVNNITQNSITNLEENSSDGDEKKKFRKFLDVVSAEYIDINELNMDKKEMEIESKIECEENENVENDSNTSVRRSQRKQNKENETYLMVADKHVPCRAWASLPTNYLYIGKISEDKEDYAIFPKKEIPVRTKFGPFDGDIKDVTDDDLNAMRDNGTRILFLNDSKKLDVSNEYTSNWMRFVRYANNYSEQNLLLYEFNNKLYFITLRIISLKEELKVGYSEEYAAKYNLEYFVPDNNDKTHHLDKEKPWPCFECKEQFVTSEELQTHLNVHEVNEKKTVNSSNNSYNNNNNKQKRALIQKKKNKSLLVCQICSNKFANLSNLKDHMSKKHINQTLSDLQNNDDYSNDNFVSKEKITSSQQHIDANTKKSNKENKNNCWRCNPCRKSFATKERYMKHCRMVHVLDENKTEQCEHCSKYFSKPSSLVEHVKTHIRSYRIFYCVLCKDAYRYVPEFKEHVKIHATNGIFTCPHCNKNFKEYFLIRKHIRSFHPDSKLACSDCGKLFPTLNKLQFHKLRHSDHREFLCSECGIQFKRKDKLIHHVKKFHSDTDNGSIKPLDKMKKVEKSPLHKTEVSEDNESTETIENKTEADSTVSYPDTHNEKKEITVEKKKFQPKVSPNDYKRFIYKCHDCLLGFKRRGMLVNHLAKRHPDIRIDSVPELNLPILKAERYYYCQYCEKVYKSSSKRKAHIIKNHPGSELPLSNRHKGGIPEIPGFPNPTYSETIGNITTNPQGCAWCHKQYASKAKLIQHQRKKHPEHLKEVEMSGHNILNVITDSNSHNMKYDKNANQSGNEAQNINVAQNDDISSTTTMSIYTKAYKCYINESENDYDLNDEKNLILIEEHHSHAHHELEIESQTNEEMMNNQSLPHIFHDIDFLHMRPVINGSNKLLINENNDYNYSHNTG